MRKFNTKLGLALVFCLLIGGNGCILEDIVAQIVITSEACSVHEQRETDADWNDDFILSGYAADLDSALAEGGWTRADIESASLMAGHYGVTDILPQNAADYTISGSIEVQRQGVGGFVTLIDYASVVISEALGQKIAASMNSAGVAVINQALADYLTNPTPGINDPVLVFRDNNATVVPDPATFPPSPVPLAFDWKAWITVQVILNAETEVPDPF